MSDEAGLVKWTETIWPFEYGSPAHLRCVTLAVAFALFCSLLMWWLGNKDRWR